ncbi:MAG: tRNA threonylcarbamoyladenosine dehydratase [Succinivibrionaceae bacterium]|nr:tRNA threonylcarbamoyladenosine dehydratase [Succinivibrionaceae bacterium]
MSDYLARFRGVAALYGLDALNRLKNASLTIAGVGGVGSWAAEAAARTGIGHIRIIDHDDISITNVNRQCHALASTIGKPKAEVFAARLKDINPDLDIRYHRGFMDADNIPELFPAEQADTHYVIEAIDSIDSKAALINHLKRNHYTFVVSGGGGGKTDASRTISSDLSAVKQDPLLASLRQKLRENYGFTARGSHKFGIRCVYIDAPRVKPASVCSPDEIERLAEHFDSGIVTFGTCMAVTATLGLAVAREMIARIVADVR